jgi:cytochrome c oxidase cbb3-type subunit 2
MKRWARLGAAIACVTAAGGNPCWAAADTLTAEGQAVYDRYCVGCHGVQGDGRGPAAAMLIVKPRDFTKGVFKFRSTPSGELPTDEDLYRIITRGVYRTSMPAWGLLSEHERLAVVSYVKGFYPQWSERGPATPIFVPEPPETLGSEASVKRGRELYEMLECTACHGTSGRGDGESAKNLPPDVWGNPQKPFDFTKGRLKSGPTVKDVYRTFMTGVGGTAMPSYSEIFAEPDEEFIHAGDAWNLVSYILSLRQPAAAASTRVAGEEAKQ